MSSVLVRAATLLTVVLGATLVGRGQPAGAADATTVIVHYHRFAADYAGWNLWLWPNKPTAAGGAAYTFDGTDSFGEVAHAQVPCACTEVGIIVRLNEWQDKDVGQDRFIETPNGHAEVWVIQGDPTIYYSAAEAQTALAEASKIKPAAAFLDGVTMAAVTFNHALDVSTVKASDFTVTDVETGTPIAVTAVSAANAAATGRTDLVQLTLASAPDVRHRLKVAYQTYLPIDLKPRLVLNDPKYVYAGDDLGAVYSSAGTSFRVWAPLATSVALVLTPAGTASPTVTPMQPAENGTWTVKVTGDLKNAAYLYRITNFGNTSDVVDPYARNITVNGKAGMVVDLAATDPPGWSSDQYRNTAHQTDATIYEVHVRDFSIDPNSGMQHRGKYLAFTEHGTHTPSGVPTGIDSVKALGVSHIELLPIQGCATLDEIKGGSTDLAPEDPTRYNWCYDPRNYNVPNGAYATDPNGTARITEVKQMVQAIHGTGMGVIQDVVYPHTYATSVFDPIVPGYFYRTDNSGNLLARTGVGNEVAAERPMVRKFILDSVKYWAQQYHMDGFRFDQMAYLGKDTVTAIAKELRSINPHAIMLGEPWASDLGLPGSDVAFTQGQQKNMHVGMFNDNYRDGLTGNVFDPKVPGYATGNPQLIVPVWRGAVGNIRYSFSLSGFASQPDEVINYVSVHDGYTLWDHVAASQPSASEADRIKMDQLAQAAVFTAQGVAYMEGGAEFLRTKGGNGNSYQAGDAVNMLDWIRKGTYPQVYQYYANLIHLRNAHPAFRMTKASDITKHLTVLANTPRNTAVFQLKGHANKDKWKNILVIYNPNSGSVKLKIPKGTWTIVATTGKVGEKSLGHAKGTVNVPALTAMILHQ